MDNEVPIAIAFSPIEFNRIRKYLKNEFDKNGFDEVDLKLAYKIGINLHEDKSLGATIDYAMAKRLEKEHS